TRAQRAVRWPPKDGQPTPAWPTTHGAPPTVSRPPMDGRPAQTRARVLSRSNDMTMTCAPRDMKGLTFDMSGGTKWPKAALGRPLDGGVRRRHVAQLAWQQRGAQAFSATFHTPPLPAA